MHTPLLLLYAGFVIWMLIDAIRREEWLWVVFMVLFPPLNAPLYFFLVYRNARSQGGGRFEFPGSRNKKRIKELEIQIRLLDKAHHYLELGNIYYEQGTLDQAHACYQSALERDPSDIDIQSRLGQCLLKMKKPGVARAFLESVCKENSKHDYGQSLMGLAEAYIGLNDHAAGISALQRVLQDHSYARARVQLAELYFAKEDKEAGLAELKEVLNDDANAPAFQRKRDRDWVRRAKQLLR